MFKNIKILDDAFKDLNKIDKSVQVQIFKKLKKISDNPEIGKNLSGNLVGLKKVYVNNKKIRIVYKLVDEEIQILIIAIGKRENKEVYKNAFKRII